MDNPAWERLPAILRERLRAAQPEGQLYEIRLRAGGRMQLTGRQEDRLCGEVLSHQQLQQIASALMEFSLYAWEDELSRGYFTTRQGFRVGVAGKYRHIDGKRCLRDVHSLCIRLAHAAEGCAEALMPWLRDHSCLILAPPGCGKTTLLRDIARTLSREGQTVALLDERSEIAAAWQGQPGMNVSERTDVIEGVDKPEGIPMIVRALAPQVIVTDELGGTGDAEAVLDALRCGVRVMASAHAASLESAMRRKSLAPLLDGGFDMAVELTSPPGRIAGAYLRQEGAWKGISCRSN